jgi:chemotaxis protein MotA
MFVILGSVFVIGAVLTGFTMSGGHVGALIHPSEFITIGGAAFGALVVMSPKKVMVDLVKGIIAILKPSPFGKPTYIDLFKLLYSLSQIVRRDGLLALDSHLTSPHESPLFNKYPSISKNHHVLDFIVGALGMLSDGKMTSEQLADALETEIGVLEHEHHAAVGALAKTADALPGFGIVAAVLGIVITMGAINGPAEEIGHKVGTALVGTFLGILMSYGFFNPMAARMDFQGQEEMVFFRTIVAAVVALNEGATPRDMIMTARRGVGTEARPTLEELEQVFKETGTDG